MKNMIENKEIKVMVAEKKQDVLNSVIEILKARPFKLSYSSVDGEVIRNLKNYDYDLILIGEIEGGISPFDLMKAVVKISPMTSVILITDAPEEEVHERAEGYGILGSIAGDVPKEKLIQFLDGFEAILKSAST